jgi:rhodanese-related sulfurtransferase
MNRTVPRISAEEAHRQLERGDALLVCAYDDPHKFAQYHLEGALSLPEFKAREGSLSPSHEIIFYCA